MSELLISCFLNETLPFSGASLVVPDFGVYFTENSFTIVSKFRFFDNTLTNYLSFIPEWVYSGSQIHIPNIGPHLPNIVIPKPSIRMASTDTFLSSILEGVRIGAIHYDPIIVSLTNLLKAYPALTHLMLPCLIHAIASSETIMAGFLDFLSSYPSNLLVTLNHYTTEIKRLFFSRYMNRVNQVIVYTISPLVLRTSRHVLRIWSRNLLNNTRRIVDAYLEGRNRELILPDINMYRFVFVILNTYLP